MGKQILKYNRSLKNTARHLRKNMTESEQMLWSRLRGKQILGVQFFRQKPLDNFIVDFFAPKGKHPPPLQRGAKKGFTISKEERLAQSAD
jgi:very-short-patch-repair endonuclease